ncbi:MAG: VanZ family protein [Gemmatimonadaceae bacterium]
MQQRVVGRLIAAAWLVVVAVLTLTPTSAEPAQREIWCLACGELGGRDLLLNVLLFVPFGFALRLAGMPARRGLLLVVAVTLVIEVFQMKLIAGRDASLGDLVANTVGGVAGYVAGARRRLLLLPGAPAARRLSVAGASLALGICLTSAWGVQPSLPRTRYYAQWAAELSNFGHFTGTILGGRAGEEEFPPVGEIAASAALRERLLGGRAPLAATVVPDPEQEPRLSPILSIFDEDQREIVLLGQQGSDLVFRVRTRSTRARFQHVGVRLENVFEGPEARARGRDTTRIAGGLKGAQLWTWGSRSAAERGASVTLSPALGWVFLMPAHHELGRLTLPISAAWIAALFLPAAYWSGRAARQRGELSRLAPAAVALVVALGVVPSLFGFRPTHWSAWVAGAVAVVIGTVVGRRAMGGWGIGNRE